MQSPLNYYTPGRIECCDFRKLVVSDADLILTDPPWAKKYLDLWAPLGEWARDALRPGGTLITTVSSYYLPEITSALAKSLVVLRDLVAVWPSPVAKFWSDRLKYLEQHRLYLWCYKPPLQVSPKLVTSVIQVPSLRKVLHPWQQPLAAQCYFIDRFTQEGQFVADPMIGSGTVGLAARMLGRKFVGCDIDPLAVEVARKRLAG